MSTDCSSSRLRHWWLWLILLAPTATEWIEGGRLPTPGREFVTDIVLTVILAVFVLVVMHQSEVLRLAAETDVLTGMSNRRCFRRDLDRAVAHAHRYGTTLVLALVDVDRFKSVNDTLGHAAGDQVLRGVGEVLRRHVRASGDHCYRIGGDEFAILVEGAPNIDVVGLLERIRLAALEEPAALRSLGSGLSIGAVAWRYGEAAESFTQRADERMYGAKRGGRGRIECDEHIPRHTTAVTHARGRG